MSYDINIKQLNYDIDEYGASVLKLEFSGKDVSSPFINSLRKVCINQIPTYAFHSSKINILRNSSVFDCSEMKLRLSQIPIMNLKNNVKFLPLKYYKNVNFSDIKLERHPEDDIDVEIYINSKNNGPEKILNVTTNDIRISINNEIIENKKMYSEKFPLLLIQLRSNEEFECSMKSVLATGELDAIFNSSNSFFEEVSENKYIFTVQSFGQLTEYELIKRGLEIIIEKLNIIKENITSNQYNTLTTASNSLILEITNEDHTCGGPLNFVLQGMKEVEFSGISKPDFLQKNICLKIKIQDKLDPYKIIGNGIDSTIKQFEFIQNKFNKIIDQNTSKK
jgi:DNA-directed RNA polymerase subunit L